MKRYLLLSIFLISLNTIFAQELSQLDSINKVIRSSGEDSVRVKAFIYATKIYYKASNFDSSIVNVDRAIALSQKLNSENYRDQQNYANTYRLKARIYLKMKSDYRTSMKFYKLYYDVSEKIKDKSSMADAMHGIANTYLYLSDYQKALEYYIQSAKINEETGNKTWLANDYTNMAIVYMRQKSYQSSIDILIKASALYSELKDEDGLSAAYKNLGVCYGETDKQDEALKYYLKCVEIEKKAPNENLAATYNNIGIVYMNKKNTEEALKYFNQSYELLQVYTDSFGLAYCYQGLGSVYTELKQYTVAQDYLMKATVVTKNVGMNYELMDNYGLLAANYASLNDYANAYKYRGLQSELKDTIHNSDNRQAIAEMQTKFETDAKEKQIELLQNEQDINNLAIEKQRIFIISAIVGILALLVIALLFYNRNRIKQRLNDELESNLKQRKLDEQIIQEKNKDIIDSINYAKRIQTAILPSIEKRTVLFPESFILFKPRDIVSGDFYWYAEKDGKKIIAAVDFTGHGVPGAFMSMIGNAFLNEIVNKQGITNPGMILSELRYLVISTLKQSANEGENKDGMDISLVTFDTKTNTLEYAGANNPLWICTTENGEKKMNVVKADKRPIGYFQGRGLPFSNNIVEYKKGDVVYLFTDGFADQFGGVSGKKFKYKKLQETLLSIQNESLENQKEILESIFDKWKGKLEQVDDMLVIGVKFG